MHKRTMLLALAAALLVLGERAEAQGQGIEVKLSGQVNRSILRADDGVEEEWFNTDNDNSSTRFRFTAEGPVNPGLRAGVLFEVEYQSNPTNLVTFATRQTASPTLDERHMDVFLAGGWGMVRLGQGSGAADNAVEVDLSGTSVAHYADVPAIGGAFGYRNAAGALSGETIGGTLSGQDFESRYDRLLYRTPAFAGFTGEASWGHKATDVVEAAVRYSGKLGALGTLAGALGYSNEDAAPGGVDDKTMGGSVSWLHTSGINLTYGHTTRELAGRDGKFNYFKVGYKTGKHAVSVDYARGDDQDTVGDEAKMYGLGYVYSIADWAELFGLLKRHSLDRPGIDLEDVDFMMVGTRVRF